ncbi:DUF3685 domain-containing protein [Prochlorococcus marinus]|uniref:DUF3685 domain-containing protein n=1 Tax=Prochlorococcus marinus XMU1408 TaxID=2213228 RepID=A0A318R452_PROMR|nr:DUF3685 domain-containing protein [Prochlorococcus marinus]MBW3041799.1 DUF3685 domain-containing protein [Prochlorococcus marinus str. XMU1408]PYE02940.1 DUF3685 domain-containing protein [Prochlorococcus marinus XMU1408]
MIAPSLLGESLALQLTSQDNNLEIILDVNDINGLPKLILFCLEDIEISNSIKLEIFRLKERWNQTPILIVIPKNIKLSSADLMSFGGEGVIQDPTIELLKEAINTLIGGGRVFKINNETNYNTNSINKSYGLGHWLLTSGLSQINKDLHTIEHIIAKKSVSTFYLFILIGRRRELLTAKRLILWLWGPLEVLIDSPVKNANNGDSNIIKKYSTDITIKNSSMKELWKVIYSRVNERIQDSLTNSTDELSALFSLNNIKRINLLKTLLYEFSILISKLDSKSDQEEGFEKDLQSITPELRANTLRNFIDSYHRLQKNGVEVTISDYIINNSNLGIIDDELPSIDLILDPILNNKPVIIDGQYLSIEDPRAFIQLEMLILNWIFRTAELLSEEIISSCSEWPQLRKYFLNQDLISTRELERKRNQINTKNQIQNIFKKPVRLYESKRLYYTVNNNAVEKIIILEPRDDELRKLDWAQRQIAFIIELRDALAPQVQSIIQYLGDLIVLILTKVIGRSIGLVGRGIAQGMGKNLSKG